MSEQKLRVMAVGAHAADMELTCGALLAKYARRGHQVTLLHLTPGEKGHPTLSAREYAAQKIEEANLAGQTLGATVRFMRYQDALLPHTDEVSLAVCDVIREVKPDIVITHWMGSIHKDHRNAHFIVNDAILYAALPAIERKEPAHRVRGLFYAENWEDMEKFTPEVYVDVSETFDTWLEAINKYELVRGRISNFRYLDYYKALAVMRGCLSGFQYAETFMAPWLKTGTSQLLPL